MTEEQKARLLKIAIHEAQYLMSEGRVFDAACILESRAAIIKEDDILKAKVYLSFTWHEEWAHPDATALMNEMYG